MKYKARQPGQIYKSLFLISLITVVGFMTTQALFVDREQSVESSFVVGTLDMTVGGPGSQQAERLQVSGIGAESIVSGGKSWEVKNVGSLPGSLSFSIENIKNQENGCNEPEELSDQSCGEPGENQGELGENITTTILLKTGDTTQTLFSSTLATDAVTTYQTQWENTAGKVTVEPGATATITMNWSTEESEYGNEVQSDSTTFDVLFNLRQIIPE